MCIAVYLTRVLCIRSLQEKEVISSSLEYSKFPFFIFHVVSNKKSVKLG